MPRWRRRGAPRPAPPLHDVRARSRLRLEQADLWGVADVTEICTRVRELTGRRLVLSEMALGHQPIHGLLVSTDDVDYVIYEAHTSRFHQDHIVLHELSHTIWGHTGTITTVDDVTSPVRILGRHTYDDIHECEAEMMATLMGQFIAPENGARPTPVDPALARVLRSFALTPIAAR